MVRLEKLRRQLGLVSGDTLTNNGETVERHQITRSRHELRRRTLTVASVEQATPNMVRVGFTSADLADFVSDGFDDHVKLFFPADGPAAEGERPIMRDFTPRRFEPAQGRLLIDFALHESGPATTWARAAKTGDTLAVGGPRGSMSIADDFDWYLLVGDESALPAIGRRLEELRPEVPVTSFVIVDTIADAQMIDTSANWTAHWVTRKPSSNDADTLIEALAVFDLPAGDGFVWAGAESSVARAVRRLIVETRGHPKAWCKAAGYWRRGEVGAHERIED